MKKLKYIAMSIGTVVLTLALATSAFADSPSTTPTIDGVLTGGSLTALASSAHFTPVTIDGTNQTPTATLPISVVDPRGTGAGWSLTLTSTTLATSGIDGDHELDTAASAITHIGETTIHGNDPVAGATIFTSVPAATAGGTAANPVKIFSAATGSGMGSYTITPTITVAIPASTYKGTYSSLYTIAAASAP